MASITPTSTPSKAPSFTRTPSSPSSPGGPPSLFRQLSSSATTINDFYSEMADEVVRIKSLSTHCYLDVNDVSEEAGAAIIRCPGHGLKSQQWRCKLNSDKTYTLIVAHSKKALAWSNEGTLSQENPGDSENQNLRFMKQKTGSYMIFTPDSKKCFSVNSRSLEVKLSRYDTSDPNQHWQIIPVMKTIRSLIGKEVWITSKARSKRSLIVGGDQRIAFKQANESLSQKWILLPHLDGTVSIVNKQLGKALDVEESKIVLGPIHEFQNQKFTFVEQKDGSYQIISKNSGKAIEVTNDGFLEEMKPRDDPSQYFFLTGTREEDAAEEVTLECPYYQRCIRWLKRQSGIDVSLLAFDYNCRCFCDECHGKSKHPNSYPLGKEKKIYLCHPRRLGTSYVSLWIC